MNIKISRLVSHIQVDIEFTKAERNYINTNAPIEKFGTDLYNNISQFSSRILIQSRFSVHPLIWLVDWGHSFVFSLPDFMSAFHKEFLTDSYKQNGHISIVISKHASSVIPKIIQLHILVGLKVYLMSTVWRQFQSYEYRMLDSTKEEELYSKYLNTLKFMNDNLIPSLRDYPIFVFRAQSQFTPEHAEFISHSNIRSLFEHQYGLSLLTEGRKLIELQVPIAINEEGVIM